METCKRKRCDNTSDSLHHDEEYRLRKKLKKLQKQLASLDNRNNSEVTLSAAPRQRSLSPFAPVVVTPTRTTIVGSPSEYREGSMDNERIVSVDESESVIRGDNGIQDFEDGRSDEEKENSGTELDEAVLSILGYNTVQDKKEIPPFQKNVALAWTNILKKGLSEEERSSITNKYSPPDNCALLEAPKLNLEVASAIREVVARRDKKISELQNQMGTALSALGHLLTGLLGGSDVGKNMLFVQQASDASRLLLDLHHKQSISRRELVSLDLKKEAKETLSNSHVDGWLFGDKLRERLKVSKEVERSGLDLKPRPKIIKNKSTLPSTFIPSRNLNSRGPPRPQGNYQGGRRQSLQVPRNNIPQLRFQHQERRRGDNQRTYRRDQQRQKNPREKF